MPFALFRYFRYGFLNVKEGLGPLATNLAFYIVAIFATTLTLTTFTSMNFQGWYYTVSLKETFKILVLNKKSFYTYEQQWLNSWNNIQATQLYTVFSFFGLVCRGFSLNGGIDGLSKYCRTDLSKLLNLTVMQFVSLFYFHPTRISSLIDDN